MKKVLHILPMDKLSGAEKVALLISKNLKSYEPIVICGGENLKKIFEENNIKAYSLNFTNKKIISLLFRMKNIIKENNIKLIHAHDNTASISAYLMKKIYGLNIKIISHIHSSYPWLKENSFNKKIDSVFRKKYDLNLACGNLIYNFYETHTQYFPRDKVDILSNAIDINEIVGVDFKKVKANKEKFNVFKDKTIIGFIGRLEKEKGIIEFISNLAMYKESFKDCKFILIGSGSLETEIKSLIKKNELEELFILTGFQSDVYNFYPLINIFFLPSLYEGLPMVILEAMASKIPVVSMNVGSINEVIYDESVGVLIDSGLYEEFIKKLILLKNNKIMCQKIGENASNIINENYNINQYIDKLEKIYFEVEKEIK